MKLASDAHVVVSKDQVACDLGGDATVVTWKDDIYYGLDPVGKRVWQLIQEPVTVTRIRDVLKAEYDVDESQLEADIRDLLEQLAEQGLIEITQ